MADIFLPRASAASTATSARSRRARVPSAADVPSVRPPTDPGLNVAGMNVPSGAFGGQAGAEMARFGGTLTDFGAQIAQVTARAEAAKRRAAVDSATVRATADLKNFVLDLQQDPDYRTYPGRFKERAQQAFDTYAQGLDEEGQAMFRANFEKLSLEQAYNVRVLANKRVVDSATADLTDSLDGYAAMGSDAKTAEEHDLVLGLAQQAIQDAQAHGIISAVEAGKRRRGFIKQYSESTIRNWFSQQPDRLVAAQQLYDGRLPDKGLQKVYDQLSPEDRQKVFESVVNESSKLLTIKEQIRQDEERQGQQSAQEAMKSFYADGMTTADRYDLFQRLRHSPYVDPNQTRAMEQYLREGGQMQDVSSDVTAAEAAIRRGDISSLEQLTSEIGASGWHISFDTIRRLNGMIETHQGGSFRDVLNWGQSELGIASGAGLLGDVFKDPIDKAAQFEAQLRRFQHENPDAKPEQLWAEAEKIVTRLKSQGNAGALEALPVLVNNYRKALGEGDPEKIANARTALTQVMITGGLVDPLTAAGENFDPLALIESRTKEKPNAP